MWQPATRSALKSSEITPNFLTRTIVCGTEQEKVVASQRIFGIPLKNKDRIKKFQKS